MSPRSIPLPANDEAAMTAPASFDIEAVAILVSRHIRPNKS
jgi:hypothetical protein